MGAGGLENLKFRAQKSAQHSSLFAKEYLDGLQVMRKRGVTSDWSPPASLPDLRRHKYVALDTEGKDDGLSLGVGSSWPSGRGHISGVSLAWPGGSLYAPTRHADTDNLDETMVAQWIVDHIAAGVHFITHHGSHDWGWLGTAWDIKCPDGQVEDTEGMAAVVDENRLAYSLDDLCRWRGIPGKDEGQLREAAQSFGFKDVKANLWRMPARYIGPYAEQDAVSTLALHDSLRVELEAQELVEAYQVEMDILPMCLQMRRNGISVDIDGALLAKKRLIGMRDEVLLELGRKLGRSTQVEIEECRSPGSLAKLFTAEGLTFPMTNGTKHSKPQPSFQAPWMRKHPHWLPKMVARAEQLQDAAEKFLQGYIINYADNGRLHSSINQYRGEEGGTRSHRFSYSDPPLQQMPARDQELAAIIRGAFQPEVGEVWAAADYSQQEYRLIVHFAYLLGCRGAESAVEQYRSDPKTDFHVMVSDMTGLERKPAKDTNFAKAFGAGVAKFALMIGKTPEEAKVIYDQYDERLPFVKELAKVCQSVAERRGYIKLLDGARSHFEMWEPSWRENGEEYFSPRPRESAEEYWPGRRLRRAFGHKAMNRLIQGSAARQTKAAMRACWREGLVPLIQMHDELGFSLSDIDQGRRVQEIMREAIPLCVPMKVDCELGADWGVATNKIEGETPESFNNNRRRSASGTRFYEEDYRQRA